MYVPYYNLCECSHREPWQNPEGDQEIYKISIQPGQPSVLRDFTVGATQRWKLVTLNTGLGTLRASVVGFLSDGKERLLSSMDVPAGGKMQQQFYTVNNARLLLQCVSPQMDCSGTAYIAWPNRHE